MKWRKEDCVTYKKNGTFGFLCIFVITLTQMYFLSDLQEGWTPLHLAVQSGQLDVIKLLVNRGADTNIRNKVTPSLYSDIVLLVMHEILYLSLSAFDLGLTVWVFYDRMGILLWMLRCHLGKGSFTTTL